MLRLAAGGFIKSATQLSQTAIFCAMSDGRSLNLAQIVLQLSFNDLPILRSNRISACPKPGDFDITQIIFALLCCVCSFCLLFYRLLGCRQYPFNPRYFPLPTASSVSIYIRRPPIFRDFNFFPFIIRFILAFLLYSHRTQFGFSFVTQSSALKSRLRSAVDCMSK